MFSLRLSRDLLGFFWFPPVPHRAVTVSSMDFGNTVSMLTTAMPAAVKLGLEPLLRDLFGFFGFLPMPPQAVTELYMD